MLNLSDVCIVLLGYDSSKMLHKGPKKERETTLQVSMTADKEYVSCRYYFDLDMADITEFYQMFFPTPDGCSAWVLRTAYAVWCLFFTVIG